MRWPWQKSVETKDLSSPEDWLLQMFGGGGPTASGIFVTTDQALRVPAVAAAIRLISEAAASLTLNVVALDADQNVTIVHDHPVAALLDRPNDWTSRFALIRGLVADALIADTGATATITRVGGEAREIIAWPRGTVQVDLSQPTGEPLFRVNAQPVPGSDVIHVRNLLDRAPLTTAREAVGAAIAMNKHAAGLFGRGARPGGVLSTPKTLGDRGAAAMLAGWRASQDGADNAGRTAVLWDGATWSPMALSSVDAQFQELWSFVVIEIARSFNVPPSMIGDLTRATWSNAEQLSEQFLALTLEPRLQAVENALRRALFSTKDYPHFAIMFDRDDMSKANLVERAAAANSLIASRALSPNEARTWLLGLPRGPAELDVFANPNTGASQPDAAPQPPKGNPDDA